MSRNVKGRIVVYGTALLCILYLVLSSGCSTVHGLGRDILWLTEPHMQPDAHPRY